MLLGQAFGRVLEAPDRHAVKNGYVVAINGETFQFDNRVMERPLSLVDRCGVFEAKAVKRYGPHEVASKADYLSGNRLSEFKTTLGTFDFDKYANSYQWRYMVDAFKPARVTYHVFLLNEAFNGVIELRDIDSFDLFPYAEAGQDCAWLVDACAEFATKRGIAEVLNRRQAEAVDL
jgi:hypothetical protein